MAVKNLIKSLPPADSEAIYKFVKSREKKSKQKRDIEALSDFPKGKCISKYQVLFL